MDHVELSPYPFPEGVTIPRLMPFQEFPFNGDGYLAAEVLRLKAAHRLKTAIETGTCLGSTTLWLSEHFATVTFEVNPAFHAIAEARATKAFAFHAINAPSAPGMVEYLSDSAFLFLDAHWGPQCPLLDELEAIAFAKVKPCILIHDFQVPGTDFGFDSMPDGRPFNMDLIHTPLNNIYGKYGWRYNYPTMVEGARRGWASFEPL